MLLVSSFLRRQDDGKGGSCPPNLTPWILPSSGPPTDWADSLWADGSRTAPLSVVRPARLSGVPTTVPSSGAAAFSTPAIARSVLSLHALLSTIRCLPGRSSAGGKVTPTPQQPRNQSESLQQSLYKLLLRMHLKTDLLKMHITRGFYVL
ncbi:unnamed protein product [Protopolystoma xenopodis]|uniref:Uncharacterized protein n=1 Tax=Protopolystoma xenopodis TaxID=117903 RepID=A0A3S5BMK8_9PLAT|nr:unnamed protein product [Protopolystoma xenopodis]